MKFAALWLVGVLPILAAHSADADTKPLESALAAAQKGDFATASKLLRAEAERGNAEAQNALGEFTLVGKTGKPSPTEAVAWFQQAADNSHPGAMFNLAAILATGAPGVEKDLDKAGFLLQAAAEAGHAKAQAALGSVEEGKGNAAAARSWYEKAAAQKQPDGLVSLARITDQEGNAAKATELYLQAAAAGSAVAMNEVGVRYQRGAGLTKDPVAAIGWFMLAAQHDLPVAHANLGNCYETGTGVLQDYDRAGGSYAAAVKHNFAPAQFLLAQLFESGKGTAVDLTKAYYLFHRAAHNGVADAAKRRDAIKAKLSEKELAQAEKLLAADARPGSAATSAKPERSKKAR